MSEFLREHVPRMPPMSMAGIEAISDKVLEILCPEEAGNSFAIDFQALVDTGLQKYGIYVYPASEVELGDRLAATDPSGDGPINILLAGDLWDSLFEDGKRGNRARATVAHELGHAVLHVPVVRRRLKSPLGELALNRVSRDSLKPYEDPEWQAWALAGCVVAPRKMIEAAPASSVTELADLFGVSEGMMKSHLKRLRLARRFPGS